jgi:predicted O-methyltransferase YrrM
MYSKSQLAYKWLQYYIRASNSRGHGVHSPFVFQLVSEVLNDQQSYHAYEKIERIKKKLLRDERILRITDPGAGSGMIAGEEKKLSGITATAVSTQRFGRLLFRLANYYRAGTIIELGTSLGISTAYLASANAASRIITLEGSAEIAAVAKETFQQLELSNVEQIVGRFDDVLASTIRNNPPADLVFLDGNHRKNPVLDYFEQFLVSMAPASAIIIHDIHWSAEMEEAWSIIQRHPKVKMSVDIFSAGLVFFRDEFQVKQQFAIRF